MSVEVRGMLPHEQPQVLGVIEAAMGATREFMLARHTLWPGAKPEHSRICLVDGEVVSHVRLYEQPLRMGGAVMRCGSIGDVCTLPEHRRRGYGKLLLEDSWRYFADQGYDFSMILSGVFEFYQTAGWEKYPLYRFVVRLDRGGVEPVAGYHVRRFVRCEDLQAVADIYEQYNQDNSLSQVRDHSYCQRHFAMLRQETEDGFLVAELGGQVVGYVRCTRDTLAEVAYVDGHQAAIVSLLEAVCRMMRKRQVGELTIPLPWREPLVDVLKMRFRCQTLVDESTLLKVVNLRAMFDKLLPDLSSRSKSLPQDKSRTLRITCDGQQVDLSVATGRVQMAQASPDVTLALSNHRLFCLLTGSDHYVELDLPPEDRMLVDVLFPRGNPVFWRLDGV